MNEDRQNTGRGPRDAGGPYTFYTLEVVAALAHCAPSQVRRYERLGLVVPRRREGRATYYGDEELARLRKIQRLVRDCGLNTAGVEVVLRLTEQIQMLRRDYDQQLAALRQKGYTD